MKNKLSLSKVIIIFAVVIALVFLSRGLNLGTFRSGMRVGSVESFGFRKWTANYSLWNGYFQKSIYPKKDADYVVEVITEQGKIDIDIECKGELIFSEKDIQTSNYKLEPSGRLTIKVKANNHKGGFSIKPVD